jgi:hypothetical protein
MRLTLGHAGGRGSVGLVGLVTSGLVALVTLVALLVTLGPLALGIRRGSGCDGRGGPARRRRGGGRRGRLVAYVRGLTSRSVVTLLTRGGLHVAHIAICRCRSRCLRATLDWSARGAGRGRYGTWRWAAPRLFAYRGLGGLGIVGWARAALRRLRGLCLAVRLSG